MKKRLMCLLFGHTIYATHSPDNFVKPDELLNGEWKLLIISCSRCEELAIGKKFPLIANLAKAFNEQNNKNKVGACKVEDR